jgi:hypothetical protein
MTNDERQKKSEARMPNGITALHSRRLDFGFRVSVVIRYSSFVIPLEVM